MLELCRWNSWRISPTILKRKKKYHSSLENKIHRELKTVMFAPWKLCGLRQVTWALWAAVFSSVGWWVEVMMNEEEWLKSMAQGLASHKCPAGRIHSPGWGEKGSRPDMELGRCCCRQNSGCLQGKTVTSRKTQMLSARNCGMRL